MENSSADTSSLFHEVFSKANLFVGPARGENPFLRTSDAEQKTVIESASPRSEENTSNKHL